MGIPKAPGTWRGRMAAVLAAIGALFAGIVLTNKWKNRDQEDLTDANESHTVAPVGDAVQDDGPHTQGQLADPGTNE